jgi:putative Flp pilus-assembly TadE/G-like protein
MLIVVIGFAGYGIDVGKVWWNVHQLHVAADSGALAGAQVVKYDRAGAILRAHDFAFANDADQLPVYASMLAQEDPLTGNEEIILGRWVRQEQKFYPTVFGANAVKVIAKRVKTQSAAGGNLPALRLVFGPIFGTDSVDAERYTTAWSRVSTGAGIICLAPDPTIYPDWNNGASGLLINGGCDIDLSWTDPVTGEVIYGDIQVNAVSMATNPKAALSKTGTSGDIICGEINVVGWTNPEPTADGWDDYYGEAGLPFNVVAGPDLVDPVEDPLLYLNTAPYPPTLSGMPLGSDGTRTYTDTITGTTINTYGIPDPVTGEKVLTLKPGWYPGGIDMTGGNVVLEGGANAVYAFGGADVKNKPPGFCIGGGSITGEGVMIYVTGGPDWGGVEYGRIDIGGNAYCELTSRGDVPLTGFGVDGTDGMILWQDIDNHNQAEIIGTASSFLKGTMYFPDNPAQVGGGTDQLGSQIICGALQINGSIDLGIAYDGRNQIQSLISAIVE